MKAFSIFRFLSIFTLISCQQSSDNYRNVSSLYFFPENIICESSGVGECFESPEEKFWLTSSQLEKNLLDLVEIDIKTEKEVGTALKNQYEKELQFVKDSRFKKITDILEELRPFVKRNEINYQIFLIEDNAINVWTTPGGYIYFSTGMYDFTTSDAEIANIIGHEIGHNECKHTHQQLQRKAVAELPFKFLGYDEVDASFFVALYSNLVIAFGQHQELEADRTGFYLAAKAGYDPLEGLELWTRLADNENENRFFKLFRSHPYSQQRYNCGKSFLDSYKKK